MLSVGTQAQRKNSRYVDYIDKYKDLAIEQMKELVQKLVNETDALIGGKGFYE